VRNKPLIFASAFGNRESKKTAKRDSGRKFLN